MWPQTRTTKLHARSTPRTRNRSLSFRVLSSDPAVTDPGRSLPATTTAAPLSHLRPPPALLRLLAAAAAAMVMHSLSTVTPRDLLPSAACSLPLPRSTRRAWLPSPRQQVRLLWDCASWPSALFLSLGACVCLAFLPMGESPRCSLVLRLSRRGARWSSAHVFGLCARLPSRSAGF